MTEKYEDRVAKLKLVNSQVKRSSSYLKVIDSIETYELVEVEDSEEEEIITLTEEVFNEENTNRSRHAQ